MSNLESLSSRVWEVLAVIPKPRGSDVNDMCYLVQVGEEVGVVTPEEVGPGDVVRVGHGPVEETVLLFGGMGVEAGTGNRVTPTVPHTRNRHGR